MTSRGQYGRKKWKRLAKYLKMRVAYIKFSTNQKNVFGIKIQNLGNQDPDPDDNAQVKNEFIFYLFSEMISELAQAKYVQRSIQFQMKRRKISRRRLCSPKLA